MAFKNPLVSTLAIQAPREFTGTLNANEVFSSIYNMIIGQIVLSEDATTGYDELVAQFRTDGSMYGDTKLFYDADELSSYDWKGDNDLNVLQTHRPADPKCQKVIIDQFRQIALTVDEYYLSKRAWGDEGAFGNFQSLMLKRIGEAKRDYEAKLMNVFVGTVKPVNQNVKEIDVAFQTAGASETPVEKEARNRLDAQEIARSLADLFDEMKDSSCDYNDYKFYRSFDPANLVIVYNAKFANEITKIDLPSLFHKDGLGPVSEKKLPAKYFGDIVSAYADYSAATATKAKPINSSTYVYTRFTDADRVILRSCYEKTVTIDGVAVHVHSGDELPNGCTVADSGSYDFIAKEVYVEKADVIAKILHKNSIPFMSGFEAGTEWFNAKALNTNKYLTWGHSELTYLKGLPVIEVKKA